MYVFIIKQVREKQGISQQELAKKTGISQNYLSEIENNKVTNVSFSIVLKIAKALNVDIKEIYIADSDIESLRKILHEYIGKYRIE